MPFGENTGCKKITKN